MIEDIAISVKDVSKSFRLPHEQHSGLKQFVINAFRRKRLRGYENQHVLKGVSFEVKKGEFLGIVGRNGSGKSTLLKLLAGIYTPDSGEIMINGSLVPFIELGVGFNPELTGRENVFLNGALLGFSRKQMEAMYDEIVEFAELGRFMDQKLKNYSSGMQVRLAFSIAIRAESDILVLDEVLAVGDEAFQRKCYAYFAELKRNKKTVILVTHSMDSVQQFCNKALLIDAGKIVEYGNTSKVAGKYMELNNKEPSTDKMPQNDEPVKNRYGVSTKVEMDVTVENLSFDIEVSTESKIEDSVITFVMNRDTGEMVYRWATEPDIKTKLDLKANSTTRIHLEIENIFPDGEYDIQVAVKKADRSVVYALFNRVLTYQLVHPEQLKRNAHWKPHERFTYEQN